MARPRQKDLNEETREEIKAIAHQLMAEKGTAGLSLRAIAREIGMSAPALYHYFASLDDLVTALILDAFNAFADAQEKACEQAALAGESLSGQLMAAALMYRQWALANPIAFQLIYGSPIPGYEAPAEQTVAAAKRTGDLYIGLLFRLLQNGELEVASAYREIPPAVEARLRYWLDDKQNKDLLLATYLTYSLWSVLHGMVMLELFNHLKPVVDDTDAFYQRQLDLHLWSIGLKR